MKLKIVAAAIAIIVLAGMIAAVVLLNLLQPPSQPQIESQYNVDVAFLNLSFSHPVGLHSVEDGTNRLFLVEQEGTIQVFENIRNVSVTQVFLDIRDLVLFGGEQGLLGLAFHPNFAQNGNFYVDYVANNPRRTVIARFSVSSSNPNQADRNSELVLLEVAQPYENHNGGQIAFGPDGYIYIALGDGGSAGDPQDNGQNRTVLLGKILRINVDSSSAGLNYSIPSDNPFVGNTEGFREEIYAYGLRNPWRFSFDSLTSRLWVADVGQDRMEEIDIVEKGKNYGWNIMEGTLCYSPPEGCNQTGRELPVWEYGHDLGYSATGGFVYHGSELSELEDAYIYGDYGSGRIWALQHRGVNQTINTALVDTTLNISSFGIDQQNELYICDYNGRIYRLVTV